MKIQEYVNITIRTDQLPPASLAKPGSKLNPALGLAGEFGSVLAELKKQIRDSGRANKVSKKVLSEELGDVLWYFVTISRRANLDFEHDILFPNIQRILSVRPKKN